MEILIFYFLSGIVVSYFLVNLAIIFLFLFLNRIQNKPRRITFVDMCILFVIGLIIFVSSYKESKKGI